MSAAPDPPFEPPGPARRVDPVWLEPYPDALLEGIADRSSWPEAQPAGDVAADPLARVLLQEVAGVRDLLLVRQFDRRPCNRQGDAMQYALLIYLDPTAPRSKEEGEQLAAEYAAFIQEITDSKEIAGGVQLHNVDTATSVRVRDGRTMLTDGPFAKTPERLGGFYLINAPDLDRALELAARIPGARTGVVEVRPVVPA